MDFSFEHFNSGDLEEFTKTVNLNEKIDYNCDFIVARNNGKIIGIAGVNFIKDAIPRFEHIIISPQYQKTKLGGILMRRIDRWLQDLGYKEYNAFIFYEKDLMRNYAKKWGMVESKFGVKGSWFTKNLIEETEYAIANN